MLKSKRKKNRPREYVSTGSTLLNLACSNNPYKGFAKGHYYFIVGDSISGKTFLSLTCLAEASINKYFDNFRFIYDNSEDGALMDIEKFFGRRVVARMEAPQITKEGLPVFSSSIEEFYFHVDDAIKKGIPFIYILDSMDALTSQNEMDKFDENKKLFKKGKKLSGSYTDGKAKKNAANLRKLIPALRDSNSILIITNQTRDSLGFGFEKKARSGGRALRFYACIELWSSVRKKIYKNIKGKKRQLGVECQIQIKKNRITGKERTITLPIYHSMGIDDVGSCVNFLIEENHWKKKGNKIIAEEFDFKGTEEKLVRYIEKEGMEKDLRAIVAEIWEEIEKACAVKRKKRYE